MKKGRPLSIKSEQELIEKIEAYWEECDLKEKPYTLSGLAYSMGITRQTLYNYSRTDEYGDIVARARARVEVDIEERLCDNKKFTPGLIFCAKNNFDYVDKKEVEQKVEGVKFEFKR